MLIPFKTLSIAFLVAQMSGCANAPEEVSIPADSRTKLANMFDQESKSPVLPLPPVQDRPITQKPVEPKPDPHELKSDFSNWRDYAAWWDKQATRPEFSTYRYSRKTEWGMVEAKIKMRNRMLYNKGVMTLGAMFARHREPKNIGSFNEWSYPQQCYIEDITLKLGEKRRLITLSDQIVLHGIWPDKEKPGYLSGLGLAVNKDLSIVAIAVSGGDAGLSYDGGARFKNGLLNGTFHPGLIEDPEVDMEKFADEVYRNAQKAPVMRKYAYSSYPE